MARRTLRAVAALALVTASVLGLAGVAAADPQGRISEVTVADGTLTYVLSAEGLADGQSIDPATVRTTIGGVAADTTATAVTDSGEAPVSRTVLITLDTSGSMAENGRIQTVKHAAQQYLDGLPADVRAGLVTFADKAKVVVAPTTDRSAVSDALAGLKAKGATALNDAVVLSTTTLGSDGSRSIVLLSDGEDEGSKATAKQARSVLAGSGVVLDAVSAGKGSQEKQLAAFARAGNGSLVTATDAESLTKAFEAAARTVASQLSVTARLPEGVTAGTTQLTANATAGDASISDTTVAVIQPDALPSAAPSADYGAIAVAPAREGLVDRSWFMILALALLFAALVVVGSFLVGAMSDDNRKHGRIGRRLQEVTLGGVPQAAAVEVVPETVLGESTAVRKAVSFADRVAASRDTTALAAKLDHANVALRPGEWAVVHALIVVLAGLLTVLFSGFALLWTLLAMVLAAILPWAYLDLRIRKRRTEFYDALPDSLQMLAGSLSAGYSLPQALDNVAKESAATMAFELNRAMMEGRLGVPIEQSLEAVAQRMDNTDFHWTVMAIRINRQVGGNLAEVLTNVAGTVRERERLRRQVASLSAEGKLSAWILALLPVGVGLFIAWRNPGYLAPLFSTVYGWLMVVAGTVLYLIGIVWMRNLVRMEV